MADFPVVGLFGFAFQNAPLDNAVFGDIETDPLMINTLAFEFAAAAPLGGVVTKYAMQPFDMHGIYEYFRPSAPNCRR